MNKIVLMILWDEQLAEILDDGNARRCWALDLRNQESYTYAHIEQMVDEELVAA